MLSPLHVISEYRAFIDLTRCYLLVSSAIWQIRDECVCDPDDSRRLTQNDVSTGPVLTITR